MGSDSAILFTLFKNKNLQSRNLKEVFDIKMAVDAVKEKALADYRAKLMEHKEVDARLKNMREELKSLTKQYDKSENDLKALQIVGEVLRQLTEEKFIVKATNGPRYVVGCRRQLDKSKLKPSTRVALDMTTLTIMRYLPREVDPLVYNMSHEDPGDVTYSGIGGLGEQICERWTHWSTICRMRILAMSPTPRSEGWVNKSA